MLKHTNLAPLWSVLFNTSLLCLQHRSLISAHQWKEQCWGTGQAGNPSERNTWALVSLGTRCETNWFIGSSFKLLSNSPWNTHFFILTGNHRAPLVAIRAIYFEQSSWNQNMGKAKEMLMCFLYSFSVFFFSHEFRLQPVQVPALLWAHPHLTEKHSQARHTSSWQGLLYGVDWVS